jgi:tRNA(Ile)-lysidine synthase
VPYVEDSSNLKDTYERNFIRHRITPLFETLNPKFREKVLLLLADITRVNARFDGETDKFLTEHARMEGTEITVDGEALKALDEEVRFRVVSRLLARLEPRFVALRNHVGLVENSLFSTRPNSIVTLPDSLRVKRVYRDLVFTGRGLARPVSDTFEITIGRNVLPALNLELDIAVSDERPVTLPTDRTTAILDGSRMKEMTVRTFREGDRFFPLGMNQSVKLKDYFISRKIPRDRRRAIPLLISKDQIAWVIGERIDNRFKVQADTRRFLSIEARKA